MKALVKVHMRTLFVVAALALSASQSTGQEHKRDIRGVALGMSASEALEVLGSECRVQGDRIVCRRSKVDGSEFTVSLTVATKPPLVWSVSYSFQTTQSEADVAQQMGEAYGVELDIAGCKVANVIVNDALSVEARPVACGPAEYWWVLTLIDRSIQQADLELKQRADFKPVPKF